MKNIILFLIAISVFTTSCHRKPAVETFDNGAVIHVETTAGRHAVRLEVISEKIIHVTATPSDLFSTTKSLMVVDQKKNSTDITVREQPDSVVIRTKEVTATVSKKTGEVRFTDGAGKILLNEQKSGKTFDALSGNGSKEFKIRQVFESTDDDAFYGLGGHQNGQMNYKGQDVEMAQHNIVDIIPFLYSSKNYGLLWDNYSISHFGDPRDYQPLSSLSLRTKTGATGGLTADYYVEDKIIQSTVADKIDYEFLETPQVDNFPKDVARKGKVVWEGSFASDKEGIHKFLVYAAGYYKVWLDDKLILDDWRQGWNPWTNKFTVAVKKGENHKLKIEWTPDGGAYIAVKHLDPIPDGEQQQLSIASEVADEINYYFVKGDNADDVIAGYRQLTGKAPIVPKWAMGYWQSRERYRSQKEILDVVKEYRDAKIPLDNIVLDWQYWEDPKWGSHEFDAKRFPDPKGMIETLHKDLHAQLMISVWPKFNKGTANYEEMNKKGFLFTRNIEKKRKDWVGIGYESTFYNPFIEEAGKLFWKQIDERLNSLGVDAYWLDATEPDMHSNLSIDERKLNMDPTGIGSGAKYFNAYSLVNSKNLYEGQRKSSPEKRVFILTRSAYAGQQRYAAATWSGDIVSRWSNFRDQIATGINFSLSGIPYWTMDIGGFATERRYSNATGETLEEWRELNARWFQYGAFCPLFRSHGQFPLREIFNISPKGHAAYNSMVYYDNLRYRLMPYLYSLAGKSYFDDYTIMRGLVMDFNADSKTHNIADQYMFGDALLINPVYEFKAKTRKVYLPVSAGWYDFYSGKYFEGGQSLEMDAPYERMPLLVKAGSILPTGPALQYTDEKAADPITLYVFAGADATFDLYEDEGVNYNYENGEFSKIRITYTEADASLSFAERKGSYKGMLMTRKFNVIRVTKDKPKAVDFKGKPDSELTYDGKATSVKL